MMDIVERLREYPVDVGAAMLQAEAADEIERLRAALGVEAEASELRKFLLVEWISVEVDDWAHHTSHMADLGYRTRKILGRKTTKQSEDIAAEIETGRSD